MKKLFIRILIGGVALVVVALVVFFFSLDSIVKKQVETVGPRLTKVEVRLGGIHLSPFSGRGGLSRLFIGNPEGYKAPSAIKVGEIKVGVELSSLRSDVLVVDEVNFQAPEITFEGTLSGNNLSKILENLQAASGGQKQEATGAKKEKKFFVKDLQVNGGIINGTIDTPLGGKSATLAFPGLHLQNIGSRENGVTAAELSKQIMKPLLASVTKAVEEGLVDFSKSLPNLGVGTTGQVDKAAQKLKDLFKK